MKTVENICRNSTVGAIGSIGIMETTGNIGTMETKWNLYKSFDESRKISIWTIGAIGTMGTIETLGAMGTTWTMETLGIVGTMENGEKMKMGSRNPRTQQTWLHDLIIKFGSLTSSKTFGSLMPFDENVEKE